MLRDLLKPFVRRGISSARLQGLIGLTVRYERLQWRRMRHNFKLNPIFGETARMYAQLRAHVVTFACRIFGISNPSGSRRATGDDARPRVEVRRRRRVYSLCACADATKICLRSAQVRI